MSWKEKWGRVLLGAQPRRTLYRCLFIALAAYLLFHYVCLPVRITGASMEPTFKDRTVHFAYLLKYSKHEPARGDIVVIAMAGRHALYLKRVLALPGETIRFDNGQLLINGHPVDESYLNYKGTWTVPKTMVPAGHYFVAGDNRSLPPEHHTLGTVERSRIVGGILF